MRSWIAACVLLALCGFSGAQDKGVAALNSVTVPAVIDHNRVVINADVVLPDGSTQRVRAWVDNGNPDLYMSRRVAILLGLAVSCDAHECSSPPPRQIVVGGMTISLGGVKEAKIPLKPVNAAAVLAAGMNVEITLPSSPAASSHPADPCRAQPRACS